MSWATIPLAILRPPSKALEWCVRKLSTYEYRRRDEKLAERIESGRPFKLRELRFAATARCPCGAGLAHPVNCGPWHYWDCSAILTGTADRSVQHTDQLPFQFWKVKSEGQPSARGATTRPLADAA